MLRFQARLRRAVLLALPAACAPSHPSVASSTSTASSSSGTGSTIGSFGSNPCAACDQLGMVCDYYNTGCISACDTCMCIPVDMPIGPTDGGFVDGGLSLDVCNAACPDPNFATPPILDIAWHVTGCYVLDGGCPHQPDGGGGGPGPCVQCLVVDCSGTGRLSAGQQVVRGAPSTLAAYLQRAAHLEALAVGAFDRLAAELGALKAPRALVLRAKHAAVQERGHARALGHLARRRGARALPVAPVVHRPRSPVEIAEENSREGCLRETWGAAVAALQSRQARDPGVRRAMIAIASEEAEHARLGWDLAAWFDTQLPRATARRLRRQRRAAMERVDPTEFRDPAAELVELAGLPTAAQTRQLWTGLRRELGR